MGIKEKLPELTEAFKERARKCASKEEFAELAKAENVELSPEQIDAIAGGTDNCPCYIVNIDCMWINH